MTCQPIRARDVESWIERFCVQPYGSCKGEPVLLSAGQRRIIRTIFGPDGPFEYTIGDVSLRSYLALCWLCGPLAGGQFQPKLDDVDAVVVGHSAGSRVRDVLRRDDDGVISCPEFGTQYPARPSAEA